MVFDLISLLTIMLSVHLGVAGVLRLGLRKHPLNLNRLIPA